jgi:hypothetical protein
MQVNQLCGTVPSTTIERDLCGAVRLVRNWGRIGTNGQELMAIQPTKSRPAKNRTSPPVDSIRQEELYSF